MSRIVEMRYSRKFNLGDYNSEEIAVVVVLDEKDNPSKVLKETINFVSSKGNEPIVETNEARTADEEVEVFEEKVAKVEEVLEKKPRGRKKSAPVEKPVETVEKPLIDEEYAPVIEESKAVEQIPVEDIKEEKEVEADPESVVAPEEPKVIEQKPEETKVAETKVEVPETKPKKTFKTVAIPYDRGNSFHKKLLKECLIEKDPEWKNKIGPQALYASKAMQGKAFLRDDENILPEFMEGFYKVVETVTPEQLKQSVEK